MPGTPKWQKSSLEVFHSANGDGEKIDADSDFLTIEKKFFLLEPFPSSTVILRTLLADRSLAAAPEPPNS